MSPPKPKRKLMTSETQRRRARTGVRRKQKLQAAARKASASKTGSSRTADRASALRSPAPPKPVVFDAIFDGLTRELRVLFELFGYGANDIVRGATIDLKSAVGRQNAFPFQGDPGDPGDPGYGLVPAGRILQFWHCDPRFLDERGVPLALKLTGAKSFETLLQETQCKFDVHAVRDTLVEANLVKMMGPRIAPVSRAALAGDSGKVRQAIFCLGDLVRTFQHNLTEGMDPSKALFQRYACDTAVPRSQVEEFKRFFDTQAMALLLKAEEWLFRAEQEAQGREELQRVNVHVFLSPFVTQIKERAHDLELKTSSDRKRGRAAARPRVGKRAATRKTMTPQVSLRTGEG